MTMQSCIQCKQPRLALAKRSCITAIHVVFYPTYIAFVCSWDREVAIYQRCFGNASETLSVAGKTSRPSRLAFSDDLEWESGHHVHDDETELIYVKKGVTGFAIDSSLYVTHANDIMVIKCDRLYTVASDVNDPATTYTCALCDFQSQRIGENRLLQPHSYPVIAAGQGKEVIKALFSELSVILSQSKNSQISSLQDALAYTLAILYYENFKNTYRSEQGYTKKNVLIKDILSYLNNNYCEKVALEQLSKEFRASVSYICHGFTKEYRVSPINCVIQRRMTEAKWPPTNTELSQAEISQCVGYENVDRFARLSLCHIDCSPSGYRR